MSYLDQLKKGATAVLIQNGSFMVTGKTLLQTFDYLERAEFSAKSLVMGAPMVIWFPSMTHRWKN